MKVAICGSGPLGIEAALAFDEIGASVTIFKSDRLGGNAIFLQEEFPLSKMKGNWGKITTELGREKKTFKEDLNEFPILADYCQKYLIPLIEQLENSPNIKMSERAERVQKVFLTKDQNENRFLDLFRVIFYKKYKSQLDANLEVEEVLNLERPIEFYEDFDVVVNATGVFHCPNLLGGGSFTLNEKIITQSNRIAKGINDLVKINRLPENCKSIVIAGSGETTIYYLLALEKWLKEKPAHKIIIITAENNAFKKLKMNDQNRWCFSELERIIKEEDKNFEQKIIVFEEKIRKWHDLEDYMKAKVPRPLEPERNIQIVEQSYITSIDQLDGKEKLYLTVEAPVFEKNVSLKTLQADFLISTTGYFIDSNFVRGLRTQASFHGKNFIETDEEKGLFHLGPVGTKDMDDRYSLSEGLSQLKKITNDVQSYFTRAN